MEPANREKYVTPIVRARFRSLAAHFPAKQTASYADYDSGENVIDQMEMKSRTQITRALSYDGSGSICF